MMNRRSFITKALVGIAAIPLLGKLVRVDEVHNSDQTGTTYTLTAEDNGKVVALNNASAITLIVPSGLGADYNCLIAQRGTGQITIAGSGAKVYQWQGFNKTAGQYALATLEAHNANVFILGGNLSA